MRRTLILATVVAVAGCGGGNGGTKPPDPRAALDGWVTKADAACKKANRAIAKRKWPANLIDLDRLSVRAADDIREASAAIQKLPPPEGAERRIAPFVATVKRLDGLIEHVTDTTEKFKPSRLTALAPKLQAGLLEVEKASKVLGMRECAAHQEHTWIPDAIRAPVFAQQLADLDAKLTRRAKDIVKPASSREDASRKMQALSEIGAIPTSPPGGHGGGGGSDEVPAGNYTQAA